MPQPPDWKRVLETGMHFTELRRSQAHRLAIDAQQQIARLQIQNAPALNRFRRDVTDRDAEIRA